MDEALRILDLLGSVGAEYVDLTLTDVSGIKRRFRRGMPLDQLRRDLARKLPRCTEQRMIPGSVGSAACAL